MRIPELLSPAGDFEKLRMAVAYGADAVYLAGQSFGMRAAASNFSTEGLREAVRYSHENGVKVYVTCNTIPTNEEVRLLPHFLREIESAGADAVIVADLGVMQLCKQFAPSLALHASTQVGVMNSATANALYAYGVRRIVLAREVSLDEIREIRKEVPEDLEIEVFCHGSMCVSFSGRCLLSSYLTGRDANRGQCAQPCRWKYSLMEENRPGEFYDITEDKGGTYILNSKDLCTLPILEELAATGINSIKIEGRTKSAYYVASTTTAYRHALDALAHDLTVPEVWMDEAEMVSHRPYSTGFYVSGAQQYTESAAYLSRCDVVGVVLQCDNDGNAVILQKNRFFVGDTINVLSPGKTPFTFQVLEMADETGNPINVANHAEMIVKMKLPVPSEPGSFLRGMRKV